MQPRQSALPQPTSHNPQPKGFSFTRTFFALIGTVVVSVVFTACSNPELDEDFTDEGLVVEASVDIDAEIEYELDAQDVYFIKMGRPPLTEWERCMYRADRKGFTVTAYCGKLPTSQQD